MHFLGAKCAKNAFAAGALSRTPLGVLTTLHQTLYLGLRGPTSKGRGGQQRVGEEREGKGRKWEGKGERGRGGKGS